MEDSNLEFLDPALISFYLNNLIFSKKVTLFDNSDTKFSTCKKINSKNRAQWAERPST